jgi:hypothetical protein
VVRETVRFTTGLVPGVLGDVSFDVLLEVPFFAAAFFAGDFFAGGCVAGCLSFACCLGADPLSRTRSALPEPEVSR